MKVPQGKAEDQLLVQFQGMMQNMRGRRYWSDSAAVSDIAHTRVRLV